MDDLISRQSVLDEINNFGRNAFKDDTDYDRIFDSIDNLPPAQQWIPVTERLPKEHEEVLTSDSVFGITFDSLHNGKWRKHPVAWMPLPESYKEATE